MDNNHTRRGLKYQPGLVVDPHPFDDRQICGPGGLYFFDKNNAYEFLNEEYGDNIVTLTVPNDERIVQVGFTKYKAQRVFVHSVMPWYEHPAFLRLVLTKKGLDNLSKQKLSIQQIVHLVLQAMHKKEDTRLTFPSKTVLNFLTKPKHQSYLEKELKTNPEHIQRLKEIASAFQLHFKDKPTIRETFFDLIFVIYPGVIGEINKSFRTLDRCRYSLLGCRFAWPHIPEDLKPLLVDTFAQTNPYCFQYLIYHDKYLKNETEKYELCKRSVARDPYCIRYVPRYYRTSDMLDMIKSTHPSHLDRFIDYFPNQLVK